MTSYTDYPVSSYGGMLTDTERTAAYAGAIERLVTAESAVLDIGCGTGFFAIYAAKLGARRVVAVEDNESIRVAMTLADKNGVADRIEFVTGLSTDLEVEERFDLIISDLRGVLPLFGHHISSLADARDRLLAPGGTLLPRGDEIYAALAQSEKATLGRTGPDLTAEYGVDMRSDGDRSSVLSMDDVLEADDLRSEPVVWAEVAYGTTTEPDVTNRIQLTATSDCRVDAIALWFDATIAEGFGYSNQPRRSGSTYGHASLVLGRPCDLAAGSLVTLDLEARLVGDEYVWRWSIDIDDPTGTRLGSETGSSAFGGFESLDRLRRRAEGFVPERTVETDIAREVLLGLDGVTDLGTIARRLTGRFPDRWPSWQSALADVADVAELHTG